MYNKIVLLKKGAKEIFEPIWHPFFAGAAKGKEFEPRRIGYPEAGHLYQLVNETAGNETITIRLKHVTAQLTFRRSGIEAVIICRPGFNPWYDTVG